MYLKDEGQPLRDAIATAGLSLAELSLRTKAHDPAGIGLGKSTIGNLNDPEAATRNYHPRTARLISPTLNGEIADFFATLPTS